MTKQLKALNCCRNKKYDVGTTDVNDTMVENTSKKDIVEDDEEERGYWGKQLDFLLSCVGYAVGLGNIWRFPYLCMRNGGGAFLIPYFTFMFIGGIPLFFMELTLGQFSSRSPLAVWTISPLFRGIGWGMVLVSGIYCVYSNVIVTWILYYLGKSFTWELPWGRCDNPWNTPQCRLREKNWCLHDNSTNPNATYLAGNITTLNCTAKAILEMASNDTNVTKVTSPGEEFWQYNVLEMSDDIGNLNGCRWEIVVCHAVGWLIIFLCLINGVKSSGKVVYVTATLPYCFLIALLVRGVTLPGSFVGISYYIQPKWEMLLSFRIWAEACLQIFFSLGPAWGGIITMASYNKFNHNIYRDAFLVPCVNCGSSFFAGFVIFSVIGYMAHEAGVPVSEAVTSGPGLAFIVYPEALTKLPGSAIWSVCFFLMLLTIGLDSQFVTLETLISGFVDMYPRFLRRRKRLFTAFMVLLAFSIGLLFTTRAGVYHFQIWDWYAAAYGVVMMAILECAIVSYIYGLDRFYYDISMMIGRRPTFLWKIAWYFITPALMTCCFCYALIGQVAPTYGDYHYPSWAIVYGWIIATLSVIPIPVFMTIELCKAKGTFVDRIKEKMKPGPEWGPALQRHRANYKYCQSGLDGTNDIKIPLNEYDHASTPTPV